MTAAEQALWRNLRDRQLEGHRFRRQVPIGRYIVDFACLDMGLVVEVDGGQHEIRADGDKVRDAWLAKEGYRVLRFWNNDVLANREGVLLTIRDALKAVDAERQGHPHPILPPSRGEGADRVTGSVCASLQEAHHRDAGSLCSLHLEGGGLGWG